VATSRDRQQATKGGGLQAARVRPGRDRKGKWRKGKPRRHGGKPLVEIDALKLQECVKLGLSLESTAALMDISRDTLYEVLERDPAARKARELGEAQRNEWLLAAMAKNAAEGNAGVQVWLSKQWLGHVDRKSIEVSGPDGAAVPVSGELGLSKLEERLEQLISRRERQTRRAPV